MKRLVILTALLILMAVVLSSCFSSTSSGEGNDSLKPDDGTGETPGGGDGGTPGDEGGDDVVDENDQNANGIPDYEENYITKENGIAWYYTALSDGSGAALGGVCQKYTDPGVSLSVLTLPATLSGMPAMYIDHEAFLGDETIEELIIPECYEWIGTAAFMECSNLVRVTIEGERLSSVQHNAFAGCVRLEGIAFPNSVRTIGESAFYGCTSFGILSLGAGVETIGNIAFFGCKNLTAVLIPNTVTSIGEGAFRECGRLANIYLGTGLRSIGVCAFYDISHGANFHIENIESWLNISFTDALENPLAQSNGETTPRHLLINGEEVTSVVIPASVRDIGNYAFYSAKQLVNLELHANVNAIGFASFMDCVNLKAIRIPAGVTSIGESAFQGCRSATELDIAASLTEIQAGTFRNCVKISVLNIPDTVESIGIGAFAGLSEITEINIPDSVVTIGSGAFSSCVKVTEVTIGRAVKTLGDSAFSGCEMLVVICVPEGVESIGEQIFSGCASLEDVSLPTSLRTVGAAAFKNCDALTELVIPSGVTHIGEFLIDRCTALKHLTVPFIGSGLAENESKTLSYLIRDENWYVQNEWVAQPISITITSAKYLASDALAGWDSVETVRLPASLEEIGAGAFSGCTSFTTLHIADANLWCGVKFADAHTNPVALADEVYVNGELLTSLVLNDTVKEINDYAFMGCTSIVSIEFSGELNIIGDYAFADCTAIETIIFKGNKSVWDEVVCGTDWDRGTIYTIIKCEDGDEARPE